MSFGSSLEKLGESILGTGIDIIDSAGDTLQNKTELEQANIDRINLNNGLALEKAKAQEDTRTTLLKMVNNVVVVFLVLIVLYFLVSKVAPQLKNIKI